jgi:GNAT superfamily N-acetyltransferase
MPDSEMVTAIERNLAEFLLALGRAGGAEERDEPSVQWVIGGSPIDYHNSVVRASLADGEVDAAIRDMIAACERHQVPGTWHVGPSMVPADLGSRLIASGLRHDGSEPGMACDLDGVADVAPPVGVRIRRVEDQLDLAAWTATLGAGFGEGPPEAEWVGAMYGRIGLVDDAIWRHYLALAGEEPVATASLFCADGVAGIYFVSTRPNARGRGIGAAITATALHEARDLGHRIAVLTSSQQGYRTYRRLGFEEFCTIDIYRWPA